MDLRNHGKSAQYSFDPPHSITAAGGDLARLVEKQFLDRQPEVVIGHSLGGKVVLSYLQHTMGYPETSILPPPREVIAGVASHTSFCSVHPQIQSYASSVGKGNLRKLQSAPVISIFPFPIGTQQGTFGRPWGFYAVVAT